MEEHFAVDVGMGLRMQPLYVHTVLPAHYRDGITYVLVYPEVPAHYHIYIHFLQFWHCHPYVPIIHVCLNTVLDATVGFEKTFYQVNESAETVEICAVVHEPDIECPIQMDFDVTFETRNEAEGTGMYLHV